MSDPQHDEMNQDAPGFFDKAQNVKWILRVFYALCVILVLLDFLVHRHIYTDIERVPTFYALYGFVACVLLVVVAKFLRKFLMREETYYDPLEDESPQHDEESR